MKNQNSQYCVGLVFCGVEEDKVKAYCARFKKYMFRPDPDTKECDFITITMENVKKAEHTQKEQCAFFGLSDSHSLIAGNT